MPVVRPYGRKTEFRYCLLLNVMAGLFFVLYAAVANWSLLLGENLMKWDIWDAEYPMQMLMSDALRNGTLPMWNPLIRYGMPEYAMIGTPIWYPVTMLLALFGYTPRTIAISYVLHIAIGGYGMFLLVGYELREKEEGKTRPFCAALAAGLLYCGSGIFLSNAQHIMIIISAAWIPYVFYFMRRFISERHVLFGMLAGLCAGMIILGGYPEMFYNLFLFLIPYTLYFAYHTTGNKRRNLLRAGGCYVTVCLFTVMASAVSLLPFLKNMGLITRGTGLGQYVDSYSPVALLSFLFPQTTRFINGGEISMCNYYVGLIVILLIPAALLRKHGNKKLYSILAAVALFLCLGRNSFLHTLFYRFLPMYADFRFPTLSRAFVAVFLILLVAPELCLLMNAASGEGIITRGRILLAVVLAVAVISGLVGDFISEGSGLDKQGILSLANSAFVVAFLMLCWILVFYAANHRWFGRKVLPVIAMMMVCMELLTFSFMETPVTIAQYSPMEYSYSQEARDVVDDAFAKNAERDRGIDFSQHKRSTSGLNSRSIVFRKTFDEEGYASFKLSSIDNFLNTFHRCIIEQNPVAYFSDNVVTSNDVAYIDWINACDTPPEQIYVDGEGIENTSSIELNGKVANRSDIVMSRENDGSVILHGPLSTTSKKTGRIRLYFDGSWVEQDRIPLQSIFKENETDEQSFSGNYKVREEDGQSYVDLYFPKLSKNYEQVQLILSEDIPVKSAQLVVTKRMSADSYVDVYSFGFNSVRMNVSAPVEGYVTLLQAKHDGWCAYVDGEKTDITLVDGCFMGLHLDAGEHSVVLQFRPKEFFVGAACSTIFGIIVFLMWIRYMLFYRRTSSN